MGCERDVARGFARAAIVEVLAWMETPSDAVAEAGVDKLFGSSSDDWKDDAREVWTAMLAAMKREALG